MNATGLHTAIVVGRFGEAQMLSGWHERESDGRNGIAYRACDGAGLLVLAPAAQARTLCVLLSGPAGLSPGGIDGAVRIGERIFPMTLQCDAWVYRQFPLVDALAQLEVSFLVPKPIVPDQVLRNGDARKLGWFLSAIWQE